jgi:N-acyl-D-aspartate/D-glutamate deacylase
LKRKDHTCLQRFCNVALIAPLVAAGVLAWIGPASAKPHADTLIKGGTVYTGADAPPTQGDVVILGDKIIYVGPDAQARYDARNVVNAKGKVVAPGFIDAHTHPETYIRSHDPSQRLNAPWLYQGVSTVLIGVDGDGSPNVAAESDEFERQRIGTNLALYVGFGAVRKQVLQESARAPSAAELGEMRALVIKGMCEGAIGLSTGLFYAPQSYATTDEVIALAKEAAKRGGIYDTHQRDESSYSIGLLKSVDEAIRIGREAVMPVHFAHIKALGVDTQGDAPQVIAAIDAARAAGQQVTADQYPWTASGTDLESALLPGWSVDGGRAALLARLSDPSMMERIKVSMRENLRRRGGADSLLLTSANAAWTGKTLAAVSAAWSLPPVDAALRIIQTDDALTDVASFNMSEGDIRLFMKQPWVVTSSDGSDGHPRQYASFPMKYSKYVRDEKVIDLGEFIRSSSGRTADIFRLDRRGYLKAGNFADVVVIDIAKYSPGADYVHPRVLAAGVDELWVNGRSVIHTGALTGEAPGRVLRHVPPAALCQ